MRQTPVRSLYCAVCRKKDSERLYRLSQLDLVHVDTRPTWFNVSVTGLTRSGQAVTCVCNTCGHVWQTKSVAGFKRTRSQGTEFAPKGD